MLSISRMEFNLVPRCTTSDKCHKGPEREARETVCRHVYQCLKHTRWHTGEKMLKQLCPHDAEFPTLQKFYEGDVCKYREYWTCEKMKMFGCLLGGQSRYQGDFRLAKNQRMKNATFDPWKSSDQLGPSEGNNQAIKHTFCRSKKLFVVANASTGDI